jgi:hypothetical protein
MRIQLLLLPHLHYSIHNDFLAAHRLRCSLISVFTYFFPVPIYSKNPLLLIKAGPAFPFLFLWQRRFQQSAGAVTISAHHVIKQKAYI